MGGAPGSWFVASFLSESGCLASSELVATACLVSSAVCVGFGRASSLEGSAWKAGAAEEATPQASANIESNVPRDAQRRKPLAFRKFLTPGLTLETRSQSSRAQTPGWGGMGWTHFLNLRKIRYKEPRVRT